MFYKHEQDEGRIQFRGLRRASVNGADLAEYEAAAALMALSDLHCSKCEKTLSVASGYFCCGMPHCPFCGQALADQSQIYSMQERDPGAFDVVSCSHLLFRSDGWLNQDWCRYKYGEGPLRIWFSFPQIAGEAEEREWTRLTNPMPPASRLPHQRIAGYPVWSQAQIAQCYTPRAAGLLPKAFGHDLRRFDGPDLLRLEAKSFPYLLLAECFKEDFVFRADSRTSTSWTFRHYHFCRDAAAEMERVKALLGELAEGTRKLREMQPERFRVRPVPRLRQEQRWKPLKEQQVERRGDLRTGR